MQVTTSKNLIVKQLINEELETVKFLIVNVGVSKSPEKEFLFLKYKKKKF